MSVTPGNIYFQIIDPLFLTLVVFSANPNFIVDNNWHYNCIDIYAAYKNAYPTSSYSASTIKLFQVISLRILS